MRWDIFCKVIDNHGDLGVCWRLACQLAARGAQVRLWVDDASALRWMAPDGDPNVTLVDWSRIDAVCAASAASGDTAPDVLIEAFGCDPAPELIANFARHASEDGLKHTWINLEYLSAEPYVERLHGLNSPVFSGEGQGLTKRFFYPGFTAATGGLLREPELAAWRARFDRVEWLATQGIASQHERLISLFCYEPAALAGMLAQLEAGDEPTRLLVTAGRATRAVEAVVSSEKWRQRRQDVRTALSISYLPHLTQDDFDHLLWSCDLNFVRGEDSFVRAHWASVPMVWQIYPQDDDAHHEKLNAWLDWLDAPASMRAFHHAWNGIGDGALPAIDRTATEDWGIAVEAASRRLAAQDDLVTQLERMVGRKS